MRAGVVFPQYEADGDPDALRTWAVHAEDLGLDDIAAFDHVLGPAPVQRDRALGGPYTHRSTFLEAFSLFAFLAAVTQRIGLVTDVLVLPQRQTALVAKQAATISLMSRGRLRLGLGVGWNHVEFAALGQDFSDRGRRFDEQITLLRALWTEPIVDYTGTGERVDRMGLSPRPSSPIPVWFGGASDAAFARAARLGDGFMFSGTQTPEIQLDRADRLRRHLTQAGRDPATFGLEARLAYSAGPDEWLRQRELFHAAGFTHLMISPLEAGLQWPDGHRRALDEIAAALT